MKYFVSAVLATLAVGSIANAGAWTDNITYNGIVDEIQDNSVSLAVFDSGNDGIVNTGDIVAGILKWDLNNSAGGGDFDDFAISVFAAQVTNDGVLSSNTLLGGKDVYNFSLGAATATLDGLLPTLSNSVGGFSAGTVGVTLSGVGGTDPLTLGLVQSLGLIDSTYALDFEFGILPNTNNYFEAELADFNGDGVISNDGTEYPLGSVASGGVPAQTQIGSESGGFSVIRDFSGPGAGNYLLVDTADLAFTSRGPSQIWLTSSTTLNQPTQNQIDLGYVFADNAFVQLNAVPEPSSMCIWAAVGVAGMVSRRRRRV
ncbi:PEP-CTERM sorting domain-containing protein [Roseiconus nitratireducens]|uniref:PEP-CTERM sorting domain-containing protein n=1 Tax=Roseiconus nitratireducens TaxID=2605748 RepID=A0A5M6DFB6_9BACT|nr:PEP-CTERM sorting domain-containing protein [Roseiconus nitratireducens]KAA5546261.1 PEP-CTERM sorting domain-containing protein [Roseiconus nitratireducens]